MTRSRNDKLNWIFNVYDKDAGGTIDPGEMKDVVTGLYTMMGIEVTDEIIITIIIITIFEVPEEILEIRSKEILEICDIDGDGEISKEEFITHSLTCDFICDMLQVMEDDEDDFEDDGEENVRDTPVVQQQNGGERKENISGTDLDPNVLGNLATKLALPPDQVKRRHQRFLEMFPNGKLTKEQFIASRALKGKSIPGEKAEALFKVFQGSSNGTMDFVQFEMAINATTLR